MTTAGRRERDPVLQCRPSRTGNTTAAETWCHPQRWRKPRLPGDEGEAKPAVLGVNLGCSLSASYLGLGVLQRLKETGLRVQYEGYLRGDNPRFSPCPCNELRDGKMGARMGQALWMYSAIYSGSSLPSLTFKRWIFFCVL